MTIRKCRAGWHLYDGRGFEGICSKCIMNIPHPTLRRVNDLGRTILERGSRSMSNLQPKTRQMPMRQRVKADFLQAHGLLTDKNLIWSQDFEGIRSDLARLIKQHADADSYPEALNDVVQTLIAEENDLTI